MQALCSLWNSKRPAHVLSVAVYQAVSRHPSSNDKDNILHYSTRLGMPPKLYTAIITGYSRHNNIDDRDCSGMTALEIAVRRSDHLAVQALLSTGASERNRSQPDQRLWRLSIFEYPNHDVTRILWLNEIEKGDYADTRFQDAHAGTIASISDSLRSTQDPVRLSQNYQSLRCVLEAEKSIPKDYRTTAADIDLAFKAALLAWAQMPTMVRGSSLRDMAVQALEPLLKRNANIYQSLDCRQISTIDQPATNAPESCACNTLAGWIMFHWVDEEDVSLLVIRHSKGRCERLAEILMDPCPFRHALVEVDRLAFRVRQVIDGQSVASTLRLQEYALKTTPKSLKYALVRATISDKIYGCLWTEKHESLIWNVIAALIEVEEPGKWILSEIVLAQDVGYKILHEAGERLPFRPWMEPCNPLASSGQCYLNQLYQNAREDPRTKRGSTVVLSERVPNTFNAYGRFRWTDKRARDTLLQLHRCIVHSVTKSMLKKEDGLAKDIDTRTRTLWALQLRLRFGLPDIPIDPSVLVEALS